MEAINEIIFFASLAFLLGDVIADQWHRKARKENTARIDAICERVKLMTDHNYALAWEKLMMELVGEDRQENVRSVIKIMQGKLQARDQEIQDIRRYINAHPDESTADEVQALLHLLLAFPNVYDLTDQQKERMKQFIVDNPYLT